MFWKRITATILDDAKCSLFLSSINRYILFGRSSVNQQMNSSSSELCKSLISLITPPHAGKKQNKTKLPQHQTARSEHTCDAFQKEGRQLSWDCCFFLPRSGELSALLICGLDSWFGPWNRVQEKVTSVCVSVDRPLHLLRTGAPCLGWSGARGSDVLEIWTCCVPAQWHGQVCSWPSNPRRPPHALEAGRLCFLELWTSVCPACLTELLSNISHLSFSSATE